MPDLVRAVDVSAWTGEISPLAWASMRSAGIELAIIQGCGGGPGGLAPNPYALQQSLSARFAGLFVAGYAWPPNWVEVALRELLPAGPLLFLAIDVEALRRVGRGDVDAVRRAGVRPVIYTSWSQWSAIMMGTEAFADVGLWDASYPRGLRADDWPADLAATYRPYGGWQRRVGWQWRGTTPLFGESVDLSVFDRAWLFGEEDDMVTLVQGRGSKPVYAIDGNGAKTHIKTPAHRDALLRLGVVRGGAVQMVDPKLLAAIPEAS